MSNTNYVQAQKFTLSGSGCTSTATSIILSSFKLIDGTTDIVMANFGDKGFATIEPGTSREEQISFTGVTQNVNGTATLTGVTRGLRFVSPYDSVAANKFSHAGGSVFIISNTAGFYNEITAKDNAETISGTWTFSVTPTITNAPVNATDAANKGYIDGVAIAGGVKSSTTTYGLVRVSVDPVSAVAPIAVGDNDTRIPSQGENDALAGTSGTPSSSNKYVTDADTTGTGAVVRKSFVKFGGTGADGALAITSGATNIDLGGVAIVTKNYTSISITGTGSLTFSNPHANGTIIILKSQGDVTITSSANPTIDLRGIGASGGIGGAANSASAATTGTLANEVLTRELIQGGAAVSNGGSPGVAGIQYTSPNFYTIRTNSISKKYIAIVSGSGGGGGGCNDNTGGRTSVAGGNGGRGGGALYLEVAGSFNFSTSTINASGSTGSNGNNTGTGGGSGGGGGGAGGMVVILYNTLVANTGSITISGGNGGNGGTGTDTITGSGGGGAGGYNGTGGIGGATGGSKPGANGSNSFTTNSGAGTGGTSVANAGGGGGGGTAGEYLVTQNTEF